MRLRLPNPYILWLLLILMLLFSRDSCEQRRSFADAYNVAYMESKHLRETYSYDTDSTRLRG